MPVSCGFYDIYYARYDFRQVGVWSVECGVSYHPKREPQFDCGISIENLKKIFFSCEDFFLREIRLGSEKNILGFVCWIDGLVCETDVS